MKLKKEMKIRVECAMAVVKVKYPKDYEWIEQLIEEAVADFVEIEGTEMVGRNDGGSWQVLVDVDKAIEVVETLSRIQIGGDEG